MVCSVGSGLAEAGAEEGRTHRCFTDAIFVDDALNRCVTGSCRDARSGHIGKERGHDVILEEGC